MMKTTLSSAVEAIARLHLEADRDQLAGDEVLTVGGPIGYRTGLCSIAEDLEEQGVTGLGDEATDDAERGVIAAYDALIEEEEG